VANGVGNIGKLPELKRRILYTIMLLGVYRIGVYIALPGVDRSVMGKYMADNSQGFMGMFNMFSGGAIEQLSIFALGIMPYISASIIFQLLGVVSPHIEALQKEGESGRQKINQYTRYVTVVISVVQGLGISVWLRSINVAHGGGDVVVLGGSTAMFTVITVISLTGGALFLMWMGEQITEHGIGNGISLLIFAGIVAQLIPAIFQTWELSAFSGGDISIAQLGMILMIVYGVCAVIVFFERAHRRLPIQHAKKVQGRKVYATRNTSLPLKVNMAGVIPPIFASSILMFPSILTNFWPQNDTVIRVQNMLIPGATFYNIIYVAMIMFFCYFYTAVTFKTVDVAENLKRQGGFIPGVRPGKKTVEYIDRVLGRITFGGAVYVSSVCVLPTYMQREFNVPFFFGGTALLIVVGVALDTAQQIEAQMLSRSYQGLTSGGTRGRGRRG
jgi:preprotein translocase subunit SecY